MIGLEMVEVDWKDCGLLDPARDVADLLTHPNQEDLLSDEEWGAFLRPYTTERLKTDPHFNERVHHYLALFPFFGCWEYSTTA